MLCTDAGLATLYEGGLTERSCATAGERGTQPGVCIPANGSDGVGEAKWLDCENGVGIELGGDMMAAPASDRRLGAAPPFSLP